MKVIKAVALDVDGVLTDGGLYLGAGGEESKRICFADIMGLSLGRKRGLAYALISGEGGPLLHRIAAKLQISSIYENCTDKAGALRSFAADLGIDLSLIAYMGDDVNDLSALEIAGLSAAPCSARPEVLKEAEFISQALGGSGAVRDLIDHLLTATDEVP